MVIEMLYFASVREAIGISSETIEPPSGVDRIDLLLDWLEGRSVAHACAFADRGRLRAAVDRCLVPLDTPLGSAREVAVFPPVTGG